MVNFSSCVTLLCFFVTAVIVHLLIRSNGKQVDDEKIANRQKNKTMFIEYLADGRIRILHLPVSGNYGLFPYLVE